jgi:hypothetical protein
MMSSDLYLCCCCYCDQAGQIGESVALGRERWGEGRGYSEVPRC